MKPMSSSTGQNGAGRFRIGNLYERLNRGCQSEPTQKVVGAVLIGLLAMVAVGTSPTTAR